MAKVWPPFIPPTIRSLFGPKKWPRFLESRPAFRSPAATAARARFHCWDTPQRRSRPDFAISCWSSRPPRPSANTAAAAASLRRPPRSEERRVGKEGASGGPAGLEERNRVVHGHLDEGDVRVSVE